MRDLNVIIIVARKVTSKGFLCFQEGTKERTKDKQKKDDTTNTTAFFYQEVAIISCEDEGCLRTMLLSVRRYSQCTKQEILVW